MVSQPTSLGGAGNLNICCTLMSVQVSVTVPCYGMGRGGMEAEPECSKMDEQKGLQIGVFWDSEIILNDTVMGGTCVYCGLMSYTPEWTLI